MVTAIYRTDDNRVFLTKEEAEAHEADEFGARTKAIKAERDEAVGALSAAVVRADTCEKKLEEYMASIKMQGDELRRILGNYPDEGLEKAASRVTASVRRQEAELSRYSSFFDRLVSLCGQGVDIVDTVELWKAETERTNKRLDKLSAILGCDPEWESVITVAADLVVRFGQTHSLYSEAAKLLARAVGVYNQMAEPTIDVGRAKL